MEQTEDRPNECSASKRDEIVALLVDALTRMDAAAAAFNRADDGTAAKLEKDVDEAYDRLKELYAAYESGLPRPALSRCPFTGNAIRYSIDTFGLDGPWWSYEIPVRPPDDLRETVYAVTGAVAFTNKVPMTPFLCKPGPGVPYVVPRILVDPEVKAVVSHTKIGEWDAYPVFYFAEFPPVDVARVNIWGLDHYSAELPHGEGYSVTVPDYPLDFEFDLAFYIRTGRLYWIAPGDETLTLRSVIEDCPYLGLEGRQYPVGIRNGEMWNCLQEEFARGSTTATA